MRELSDPLTSKRLYIADLAERLETMERAGRDINPAAYRLFSRRLKTAMAGYPERLLRRQLGGMHPCVRESLDERHFDAHGAFAGLRAQRAQRLCDALLWRMTRQTG